jgi:hypothetical protein
MPDIALSVCTLAEAVAITGLSAGDIEAMAAGPQLTLRQVYGMSLANDLLFALTPTAAIGMSRTAASLAEPGAGRLLVCGWAHGEPSYAWHETANPLIPKIKHPYVLVPADAALDDLARPLGLRVEVVVTLLQNPPNDCIRATSAAALAAWTPALAAWVSRSRRRASSSAICELTLARLRVSATRW